MALHWRVKAPTATRSTRSNSCYLHRSLWGGPSVHAPAPPGLHAPGHSPHSSRRNGTICRRPQLVACRSSQEPGSQALSPSASRSAAAWATPLDDPWAALLMAWFASRRRSFLAAQCLVEAVLQLYVSGNTFTQVQLGLKLASWGAAQPMPSAGEDASGSQEGAPQGVPLLNEQEESELLCWVALVMLSAQLSGLRPAGSGEGGPQDLLSQGDSQGEKYLRGMRVFVAQALDQWRKGMTLQRLTHLQAAVNQGQPGGGVQAAMQQYSRVAIMTLELMAAEQLIPAPLPPADLEEGAGAGDQEQLENEGTALQQRIKPTGYTATFVNGPLVCVLPSAAAEEAGGVPAVRRLAVRLLVGFMGAALCLGTGYPTDKFVETVYMAYTQGWTAGEILAQVREEDLAQSGGFTPPLPIVSGQGSVDGQDATGAVGALDQDDQPQVASAATSTGHVNKQLFAGWLSCVYMALAQLGAAFPEGSKNPGWAWAGMGDATEAAGLDSFVQGALRRSIEQLEGRRSSSPAAGPALPNQALQEQPTNPAPGATDASTAPASSASAVSASQPPLPVPDDAAAAEPAPDPFWSRIRQDSSLAARLDQLRQAAADEFASTGRLRGKDLPDVLVRMQDDELANTSSALRLIGAQTQLVRATLAMALHLQQQTAHQQQGQPATH